MLIEEIELAIKKHLPDALVIVESNDGTHFNAIVITDIFINKKPIERQRLVYQGITKYISNGKLHAISLKTYSHQEWENRA